MLRQASRPWHLQWRQHAGTASPLHGHQRRAAAFLYGDRCRRRVGRREEGVVLQSRQRMRGVAIVEVMAHSWQQPVQE